MPNPISGSGNATPATENIGNTGVGQAPTGTADGITLARGGQPRAASPTREQATAQLQIQGSQTSTARTHRPVSEAQDTAPTITPSDARAQTSAVPPLDAGRQRTMIEALLIAVHEHKCQQEAADEARLAGPMEGLRAAISAARQQSAANTATLDDIDKRLREILSRRQ